MIVAEATMKLWIVTLLLWTSAVSAAYPPETAPKDPPPREPECSAVIFNLVDCVPYLRNGSDVGKPDPLCCGGLKEFLEEDFSCLCDALESSILLGVKFDRNRVFALPSACGVDAPSLSRCKFDFDGSGDESPSDDPTSAPESQPTSVQAPTYPRASDPGPKVHKTAASPSPSKSSAHAAADHSFATRFSAIVVSLFFSFMIAYS